eukprot:11163627-Lingulodinium_polyedra.AAC.1
MGPRTGVRGRAVTGRRHMETDRCWKARRVGHASPQMEGRNVRNIHHETVEVQNRQTLVRHNCPAPRPAK